jgi:hypothetical protein
MIQCIGFIISVYALVRLMQIPFQHPTVIERLPGTHWIVFGASVAGFTLLVLLTLALGSYGTTAEMH